MSRINSQKDFYAFAQKSIKVFKYKPEIEKLVNNILENSSEFSAEKWKTIFSDKAIPWRGNQYLQELYIQTEGFPNELCEKILAYPSNSTIPIAALYRDDINHSVLTKAFDSITDTKKLAKAMEKGKISKTAINYIAKKTINKLRFTPTKPIEPFEQIALAQTTDEQLLKDFVTNKAFNGVKSDCFIVVSNNPNINDDIRNEAFLRFAELKQVSISLTDQMFDNFIDKIYYGEELSTVIQVINNHLLNEDMEKKTLLEISESFSDSSKKYYNTEVLKNLLFHTHNLQTIQEGMRLFPNLAQQTLIQNATSIPEAIIKTESPNLVPKLFVSNPDFALTMAPLIDRLNGSWNNITLADEFYKEAMTEYETSFHTMKSKLFSAIALCKGTPDAVINKMIEIDMPIKLITNGDMETTRGLIATRLFAVLNQALNKQNLEFAPLLKPCAPPPGQYHNIANMFDALYSYITYNYPRDYNVIDSIKYTLLQDPEFIKDGEKYLNAFKSIKDNLIELKSKAAKPHEKIYDTVIERYDKFINIFEKEITPKIKPIKDWDLTDVAKEKHDLDDYLTYICVPAYQPDKTKFEKAIDFISNYSNYLAHFIELDSVLNPEPEINKEPSVEDEVLGEEAMSSTGPFSFCDSPSSVSEPTSIPVEETTVSTPIEVFEIC